MWRQLAQLNGDSGGNDFGCSVSVSGETAVIGASLSGGSAYLFTLNGDTLIRQARLSEGPLGDRFGRAVAISNGTLAVGAPGDDDQGADWGSVTIFTLTPTHGGSIWDRKQKLLGADAAAGDRFGSAVSISGDTAVVGVPFDDDRFTDAGSAYIYTRTASGWTQEAKMLPPNAAQYCAFGPDRWAISGDTVLIGNNNSVAVYWRSDTRQWTQQATLTALGADGGPVALSGDTAIIGAPGDGPVRSAGSAYIFARSGSNWSRKAKLVAPDASEYDAFGLTVLDHGQLGGRRVIRTQRPAYLLWRRACIQTDQSHVVDAAGQVCSFR